LRWQIASESATHDTIGTVVSAHLAPVDAKLTIGGLGDKGDALSEVKVRISLVVAALDFDKRYIYVLSAQGSLVTEDGAVDVQAGGAFGSHRHRAVFVWIGVAEEEWQGRDKRNEIPSRILSIILFIMKRTILPVSFYLLLILQHKQDGDEDARNKQRW
jgi:hypothetical protein